MKDKFLIMLVAASLLLCPFAAVYAGASGAFSGNSAAVGTVVIDAGHGGIDGGVSGGTTGVKESELNLYIAKELERNFASGGFNVVMTRTTSSGLYGAMSKGFKKRDMLARKNIINGADADVMISIHLNHYSSPERKGAQAFYKSGDEEGLRLANCIQKQFKEGKEREYSPLVGDYYVLNESECTSVLLECGFLSNPEEERLLMSEDYRKRLAYLIYKGTTNYLLEKNGEI
ncbi:MAG: N-acetylmuramoyl-L-alanine amidase [Clostridia bacterium]|nr:N-acetylmuramoyl-L-alanine amidase [Clostridia bacterium]